MRTITIDTDNLGGLSHIYAIPSTNISVRRNADGTASILAMDTNQAYDIPVWGGNSFQFTEKAELTDAGMAYEQNVAAFIPKIRPEAQYTMAAMRDIGWIVIHQDANGNFLLSGSDEVPLRMEYESSSGSSSEQTNGYSIRFHAIEPNPSAMLTSFNLS